MKMPQTHNELIIRPVVERIFHQKTPDGDGFYETIFSIANAGRTPIAVLGLAIRIKFHDRSEEYTLEFPRDVTSWLPETNIVFLPDQMPVKIPFGNPTMISILKRDGGKELIRADVRFITR
jgi:hypothetical protein